MNLTSYEFFVFFIIIASLYWLVRRRQWQNLILLAASYIFYGWLNHWYTLLLGLSTLGDYAISLALPKSEHKKRLVWASLLLNIGVLAFFKYYDFFIPSVTQTLAAAGITSDLFLITKIALPVGLSFFSLKKLGYVLDVSSGVLPPTRDLASFALFVAFFPQIGAGPIDRAQKLLPQIESERVWKSENFYAAWPLIVMGLFKKFVVAGGVGATVSRIYTLAEPSAELALAAGLGFTLQILADFSGYTDLARGFAFLLGFETTENFRSPYLALTPTDFWNRWHITLSTWLRDYVFFPLRRALLCRREKIPGWAIQALPPLVTMFVSGLWHGVGATFLFWGIAYGVLIVIYQLLGMGGDWKPANRATGFLAWLVMFSLTSLLFLIFGAPSLTWVWTALSNPLLGTRDQQAVSLLMFALTAIYAAPLIVKLVIDRTFKSDSLIHALYYAVATLTLVIYVNSSTPDFIYFQF